MNINTSKIEAAITLETLLWDWTYTVLGVTLIDGTKASGDLMKAKLADGSTAYRQMTEAERQDYKSSDAW